MMIKMFLGQSFCVMLLAGILMTNSSRHPAVFGQNRETNDPCQSVEEEEARTFGYALNCSGRFVDNPTNISSNGTSVAEGIGAEGNTITSLIDTGLVSKHTAQSVDMISSLVIAPVLNILGLVGNILSLRTLLNQKPRDAIKVYLISLSMADILVLTLSALLSAQKILYEYYPLVGGRIKVALFSSAEMFAHLLSTRISAFLTAVLSLERCFAVALPFKVKHICLSRYPWRVVSLIYIGLIIFYIPNIFRFNVFLSNAGSSGKPLVVIIPSDFSRSVPLFYTYYGVAGQIFTAILPLVIVLMCNVAIILSLKTSSRYRQTIGASHREDFKLTRLLLTISAIFIVCTIPGIVNGILVKVLPTFGFNRKEHYLYTVTLSISGTLIIVNSAVNFIVYMFIGENFRKCFYETWGFARQLLKFTKEETKTSDSVVSTLSAKIQ